MSKITNKEVLLSIMVLFRTNDGGFQRYRYIQDRKNDCRCGRNRRILSLCWQSIGGVCREARQTTFGSDGLRNRCWMEEHYPGDLPQIHRWRSSQTCSFV